MEEEAKQSQHCVPREPYGGTEPRHLPGTPGAGTPMALPWHTPSSAFGTARSACARTHCQRWARVATGLPWGLVMSQHCQSPPLMAGVNDLGDRAVRMSPLHREGPLPPPTWAAYGAQTAVRGRPWMKLPLLRKKWFATNNVVVFFFYHRHRYFFFFFSKNSTAH